ncbi:hypothetical protein CTI12_AA617900 [Artemisia annua]|uniref:Ulp1 protease family, C-terminal catalytic domain-containing protein n=1 Tax=Artemisia annua TaxID=35608 RepID=A0A2U1KCV9_ARTAN|nr:hypothetical protein CTI12_AA617900 [Artemisia annua]
MSKNKGKKKEKELTLDEIRHQDYLLKLPILQARTAPTALHTAIHGIKKFNVEKFLAEIGFSSFYKFDIDYIPSKLGRYVVENFDEKTCRLKLENEKSIEATVSKVHDLLGIPIGGVSLLSLETRPVEDEFEEVCKSQFETKKFKKVRVNDIALKLTESKEVDFLFKINFLTLLTNTMGMCSSLLGEINLDVVRQLLYLDSTNFKKLPVVRTRPAIKQWSSFLMAQRQDMELKEEYFGMSELYDESELSETEGFIAGSSGSSDTSYKEHPVTLNGEDLEGDDDNGNDKRLSEGSDDGNGDDKKDKNAEKRGDNEGSDDGNGDDKKDKDAEKRRDSTVVDPSIEKEDDAVPENQVDEPFSLTQWIENHLDLNEEWFNCAAAEFYYLKSVAEGTMEPMGDGNPGAITPQNMATRASNTIPMFDGTLESEDEKFEEFEKEISAQFKDDVGGMALNGIELLYGHNKHVIIRKVKPRIASLKWKTKNNFIDCGVFTMLHMDNYTGEAPGKWDCDLVSESKEQYDQLRLLRFKFATKILLHEVNVHAGRMYELALEFDKLPTGEKLSIILSVVRNRDARDRKF